MIPHLIMIFAFIFFEFGFPENGNGYEYNRETPVFQAPEPGLLPERFSAADGISAALRENRKDFLEYRFCDVILSRFNVFFQF